MLSNVMSLAPKIDEVRVVTNSISPDFLVVVVSPLNALIENQIVRLGNSGIRATALDVKSSRKVDNEDSEAEPICELILSDKEKLEAGYYKIVFAHPQLLVSCACGRKLMHTEP